MPNTQRMWIIGAALGILGVTACGDVTGPPTSGTYVLREADGQALPVTWKPGNTQKFELLGDTLVLSSDHGFRRARALRITDLSTGGTMDVTEAWGGSVTKSKGAWVLIQEVCGPDGLGLCLDSPTIRPVGPDVEIRTHAPPASVLLFVPCPDAAE